jgi:hypothetical protein
MVTTKSAPSATAAGVRMTVTFGPDRPSAFSGERFQTARDQPAVATLRAMPSPILPRPMKPTFALSEVMAIDSSLADIHRMIRLSGLILPPASRTRRHVWYPDTPSLRSRPALASHTTHKLQAQSLQRSPRRPPWVPSASRAARRSRGKDPGGATGCSEARRSSNPRGPHVGQEDSGGMPPRLGERAGKPLCAKWSGGGLRASVGVRHRSAASICPLCWRA